MTDLPRVDANLIVVLDAIMTERNLTRAGEAIGMAQSSVSGALARLRRLLDDEILVRSGRSYELTPRAAALQPLVTEAVRQLERTYSLSPAFDPMTSERTFLVSASDYAFGELTGPLLRMLSREAPGMAVEFDSLPTEEGGVLESNLARRDVVIASTSRGIPGRRLSLFADRFICVADQANPRLVDGALTTEDLRAMRHVICSIGDNLTPSADMLDSIGVLPSVIAHTRSLLQVAALVSGTEAVGIVPERIALRYGPTMGLVAVKTQMQPMTMVEAAYWHPDRNDDPSLRWFLGLLRRAAEQVEFPEGIDAEFEN